VTNSREKPLVSARFSRKAAKPSPNGNNIGHTLLQSSARLKSLKKLKLWQFCFLGIAPIFVKNLINEDIDTNICLFGYQWEFWHCRYPGSAGSALAGGDAGEHVWTWRARVD
jgi:hypothetical protein